MKKGFTLIEILIGVFLFALFFLGIFGVIQLGTRVASEGKNKVVATAILNGEMEKIRNLSYELVGIDGGFPSGVLTSVQQKTINNRKYTIEIMVDYIVDSKDGIAEPEDDCPNDYKKVQVKVSWLEPLSGSVIMTVDIVPSNLAQECGETGGVLYISVFNDHGEMINYPDIEVRNSETDEIVKSVTPASGQHYFSLPMGIYKIVVLKEGYSGERTYSTTEIAIPEKPNVQILENKVTEVSFSIDKISVISLATLSPWVINDFIDSFGDYSTIEDYSNILVDNGKVALEKDGEAYFSSGYIISAPIEPDSLIKWVEFSWDDNKPSGTFIKYQVLYDNSGEWILVPDSDLSGNSVGIENNPIDLSGLDIELYPKIKLKAIFSTNDSQNTPILNNWSATWRSTGGFPIPNILFNIRGEKIIGKDLEENPVYKYSKNYNSGPSGSIEITGLEWDNYSFSVESAGINLESIEPGPQPVPLDPDSILPVSLYLESQDSFFVLVRDIETENPVFSASARVYNEEYDITKYTDINGQVYFVPLAPGTYTIETQAQGYLPDSRSIFISGEKSQTIYLQEED